MGYPYAAPGRPFAQLGHETLDPAEVEIDRDERTPVLAYGSNAAPVVLARKLALSDQPVLVVPARLADFDVVYSSHISPYGALPATLQRSPGTEVRVHVIYMTSAQIGLISATEPNYEPTELEAVECELEGGETADRALGLHQPSRLPARRGSRGGPGGRRGEWPVVCRTCPGRDARVRQGHALSRRQPRVLRSGQRHRPRPLPVPLRPAPRPPFVLDRTEAAQGEAGEQAVGGDRGSPGGGGRRRCSGRPDRARRSSPAARA